MDLSIVILFRETYSRHAPEGALDIVTYSRDLNRTLQTVKGLITLDALRFSRSDLSDTRWQHVSFRGVMFHPTSLT
jgi:hypothetical protein